MEKLQTPPNKEETNMQIGPNIFVDEILGSTEDHGSEPELEEDILPEGY